MASYVRNPATTLPFTLTLLSSCLLLLLLLPSALAAGDNCYWRSNNTINSFAGGWFACNNTQVQPNGAQLCCIDGSQCGEQSICHSNTGYYIGGCTDGSYGDPICRTDCSSDNETWIIWNDSASIWECCGSNGCDGSPPTHSFSAIQPASWTPIASAPQSSSTSMTSTPVSTSASTTTTSAAATASATGNTDNTENGLSTGAKAGVGAACGAVGLAAIIAIIFWFIWRKRRATKADAATRWQQEQEQQQTSQMLPQRQMSPQYTDAAPHYGETGYYNASPATQKSMSPQEIAATSPTELPPNEMARGELVGDAPHGERK